jgi:hypothetical protein
MPEVKGVATIQGREYRLNGSHGTALVEVDGDLVLAEFSCPFESLPPRGHGFVISRTFVLVVKDGRLQHLGVPVYHEIKEDNGGRP